MFSGLVTEMTPRFRVFSHAIFAAKPCKLVVFHEVAMSKQTERLLRKTLADLGIDWRGVFARSPDFWLQALDVTDILADQPDRLAYWLRKVAKTLENASSKGADAAIFEARCRLSEAWGEGMITVLRSRGR